MVLLFPDKSMFSCGWIVGRVGEVRYFWRCEGSSIGTRLFEYADAVETLETMRMNGNDPI